ncbi:MAG: cobalamin-dependent protein, partial [Planctomycetota bacterium]
MARPTVLLCSVFGPFGVDDEYGRKENIMELMHNQVTREQGVFSPRFSGLSFGLHLLAENIESPATVLDFPSQRRFVREIRKEYDFVGISFIVPNVEKARRMAELVRKHAPDSEIILGGHGTRIPGIEQMVEHDHVCRGEGVYWLRKLLGENPDRPIQHPVLPSSLTRRVMGVPLAVDTAVLMPGVGCPNGCRFCCTSHFFDKTYTPYLDTGAQMFDICSRIEAELGVTEFFVLDENFLKRPRRA